MKKFYNAPAVELEVFDNTDVIVTSGVFALVGATPADATSDIPEIDVSELNFQPMG